MHLFLKFNYLLSLNSLFSYYLINPFVRRPRAFFFAHRAAIIIIQAHGDREIEVKVARDDIADNVDASQRPQSLEEDIEEEGGARGEECGILAVQGSHRQDQ